MAKASEMSTNEKFLSCEIQNATRNEAGKKSRLDDVSICIYETEEEILKEICIVFAGFCYTYSVAKM